MSNLDQFFMLTRIYCAITGAAEATLSGKIFADGKRIAAIRNGSDVGVRRLATAMRWFSANWPDGAEWPVDVPRPSVVLPEAAE